MEENKKQSKTFEEIDARLREDLKKINGEILEIENHLEIGQRMFDDAVGNNLGTKVIKKYKQGLEELQKGLDMFLGIREEILRTIAKLHETVDQAQEYIK